MNRADQAPEPSIEELLASIRLIITDTDKKGPSQKDAIFPGLPAADAHSSETAAAADDVFDLTDELVFPETPAAPPSPYSGVERRTAPQREEPPEPAAQSASRRAAAASPGLQPSSLGQTRLGNASAAQPEAPKLASQPPARPIWSGRELRSSAAPPPREAARPREAIASAKPQARNWAGDIQMPVPDQGPVSLFSTQTGKEPQTGEGENSGDRAFGVAEDPGQNSGAESAAVAVLAQRLARSAIGVLEASELESANQVDFEHLDAESRAEVTEKFADIMERESAALAAPMQSNSPGSVPAQVRKAGQPEPPVSHTPVLARETRAIPEARLPKQEKKAEAAEPERYAQPQRLAPPESPMQVEARPAPANQPAFQPLAQAQFVGPAQVPLSAQTGRTLEDAVREMLRPLLVQWLNENMPRILENAIREEIAVRGLLPTSDG